MFQTFLWINIKILIVMIIYGFLMGKIRAAAYRNLYKKACSNHLIDFFNLIGTPVHELGHLIFGLLFGYHIDKVCLYRTMNSGKSHGGTLGFVKMHHKHDTIFQKIQADLGQFFIGIGPLIAGPAFLYLCIRLLPENVVMLPSVLINDPTGIFRILSVMKPTDYIAILVFLYMMIGVSTNIELSEADLKMASKGTVFLEVLFFLFSVVCTVFSLDAQTIIDFIFHYIVIMACTGIFCGLFANLIALI